MPAIQLFRFLINLSLYRGWIHDVLADKEYTSFACICSVIISSRLHDGKQLLAENFPVYPAIDLI